MGAKSTRDIARDRALAFVSDHLEEVDDETLAALVECVNDFLYESRHTDSLGLHNFQVSSELPRREDGGGD